MMQLFGMIIRTIFGMFEMRVKQLEKFAQVFIRALIEGEEGLSVEAALRHTIARMGIKEFAQLAKVPQPNVSEFVHGKRKLKPETLNQYLKPFKLRVKLVLEEAS
jgi:plasmid maintenance system antidote protein VapI